MGYSEVWVDLPAGSVPTSCDSCLMLADLHLGGGSLLSTILTATYSRNGDFPLCELWSLTGDVLLAAMHHNASLSACSVVLSRHLLMVSYSTGYPKALPLEPSQKANEVSRRSHRKTVSLQDTSRSGQGMRVIGGVYMLSRRSLITTAIPRNIIRKTIDDELSDQSGCMWALSVMLSALIISGVDAVRLLQIFFADFDLVYSSCRYPSWEHASRRTSS